MDHPEIHQYVEAVMRTEIAKAIPYEVAEEEAIAFSNTVIDRFSNPHIKHLWLSITMQYTMKLKIRILPVLINYYQLYQQAPEYIVFGFAAYLHFMRIDKEEAGKYYGSYQGETYVVTDDSAAYFLEKTQGNTVADYLDAVLSDSAFWTADLNSLPGFTDAVKVQYSTILEKGIANALADLNK